MLSVLFSLRADRFVVSLQNLISLTQPPDLVGRYFEIMLKETDLISIQVLDQRFALGYQFTKHWSIKHDANTSIIYLLLIHIKYECCINLCDRKPV